MLISLIKEVVVKTMTSKILTLKFSLSLLSYLILYFSSNQILAQTNSDLENIENSIDKASEPEKPGIYLKLANGFLSSDIDKSLSYANKARDLAKKTKQYQQGAEASNILGAIYSKQSEFKKAASSFEEELSLLEKINDKALVARAQYNLASIYRKIDDPKKATKNYLSSLALAKELRLKDLIFKNYEGLFGAYYERGKYKEALENFNNYIALKDSAFNIEKSRQLSILISQNEDLKVKKEKTQNQLYKTIQEKSLTQNQLSQTLEEKELTQNQLNQTMQEKDTLQSVVQQKETMIQVLNYKNQLKEKDLELQQRINEKQRMQIYILIAGVIFTFIIAFLIFQRYRFKKKANNELALKNEQIMQQKEEILAQAENLEEAYVEISLKKDEVEKSNRNITASINYAQRIQQAVLPHSDMVSVLLPENFILFQPRDIVSGDFYFIKQIKNFQFIIVADCTGHGVPGAFMSMLGVAFLNEIIRNSEIQNAGQALDELRKQVKSALQQSGQKGEQKDGMDIAFAVIDIETSILNYAGANNSMFIIRNDDITELKGDKMPIGIYRNEEPFSNQYFTLQPDDMLYLYTDGFYSQLNHTLKEPMKMKRFKEILLQIYQIDLEYQKQFLIELLNEWKGNEQQTDDILIVGVRNEL